MDKVKIKSSSQLKLRHNRSKNDAAYDQDILECLEHLYIYMHARRTITLKHRTNRDAHRTSNLNMTEETSIIELMEDFISKKVSMESFSIPQDLLFLRKFHRDCTECKITFTTLHTSIKEFDTKKYREQHPGVTYDAIAQGINKRISGSSSDAGSSTTTPDTIKSDRNTILEFLKAYRSRT